MRHSTTLDLEQAANFLCMSPSALRAKIKKGEIKAAKPAKRWVFLKEDLVAYIRSIYHVRVEIPRSGSLQENTLCQYSNAEKRIGSVSQPQMDKEYAVQLGLEIKPKHKSSTTSSK